MKEYTTLRDLMSRVSTTEGFKKVPTAKYVRENSEVVDVYESRDPTDYRITVYKSGFAVAQSGKYAVVIRVDECGAYDFGLDDSWLNGDEDAIPHQFKTDYFLDKQWPVRLLMKAEDQHEKNQNKREEGLIGRHPEIPDDKNWMLGGYYSFEDALIRQMMTKELLDTMTWKQREVYLLHYKHGYTVEEIGNGLGISKKSVFHHLERALSAARKFYLSNI